VRVCAGRYKGLPLGYPRSGLRPTKDVTRQAIFNMLGDRVVGARVLDLFAGAGSLGIEALSRGALSLNGPHRCCGSFVATSSRLRARQSCAGTS
jgi:16S rRNA (guanine(966)-N(2))-methyltransferase RsmD